MSNPTPDPTPTYMTQADLRQHSDNLGATAALLNLASAYITAPPGSGEEEMAEEMLQAGIATASTLSPEAVGNMLLALCALIVSVTEPVDVQEWFDFQSQKISEAME